MEPGPSLVHLKVTQLKPLQNHYCRLHIYIFMLLSMSLLFCVQHNRIPQLVTCQGCGSLQDCEMMRIQWHVQRSVQEASSESVQCGGEECVEVSTAVCSHLLQWINPTRFTSH